MRRYARRTTSGTVAWHLKHACPRTFDQPYRVLSWIGWDPTVPRHERRPERCRATRAPSCHR